MVAMAKADFKRRRVGPGRNAARVGGSRRGRAPWASGAHWLSAAAPAV